MNNIKLSLYFISIVVLIIGILLYTTRPSVTYISSENHADQIERILTNVEQLNRQISDLRAQLDHINRTVDSKIENIIQRDTFTASAYSDPSPIEAPVEERDQETDTASYEYTKASLIDSLSDPMVSLHALVESDEMKLLPDRYKQEVMEEVVRRFNAGEIDRYTFIPGYKE